MKKIAKIFGAIAAAGAAVAGGIALYKKFISPKENLDDLEDDLEDEFEDEDLDTAPQKATDRSYVPLTSSEETAAKDEDAETEEKAAEAKTEEAPAAKEAEAPEAEEKEKETAAE